MEDRESITFGHIRVFVLGGLVGAIVALLFAPKSGREVREDLKDRAGKIKSSVGENLQNLSAKSKEVYDNVSARSREAYEKGSEMMAEQKGRLGAAISAGASAVKEVYKKETPPAPPEKA